jgi:hypothetical protein
MVPPQATCDAVHAWPLQHGWLAPPHVPQLPFVHVPPRLGHVDDADVQRLPTQQPPDAHSLSAQQGWPAAPHCVQTPPLQTSPALHIAPAQHGWPEPPHAVHMLPAHAPSVHVPWQQLWPMAPQLPDPVAVWLLPLHATTTAIMATRNQPQAAMRIAEPSLDADRLSSTPSGNESNARASEFAPAIPARMSRVTNGIRSGFCPM